MSMAEEQVWLNQLKVGDTVMIHTYRNMSGIKYQLAIVDKITEKKRDITVNGRKFRSTGREYTTGQWSIGDDLIEPTPARKAEMKLQIMRNDARHAISELYDDRNHLSDSQLERLMPICTEIVKERKKERK